MSVVLSEQAWEELKRLRRLVLSMNGPGVTVGPDSIHIAWPPAQADGPDPSDWFWARVTERTRLADQSWRWTYRVREIVKRDPGYGGWAVLEGGRQVQAYNFNEDHNGTVGPLGNGTTVENLRGLEPQPVPLDTPVRVVAIRVATTAEIEYWFEIPNGLDGFCT